MPKPIVEFDNVSKRFGDLAAVRNASLEILPGEVLAVLGENGAGKSTLMKLLYGVHSPDEGRILIGGSPSRIAGPSDAMRNGVGMVFQHFSLLPALSVRDNLLLAWPGTPFWTGKANRSTSSVLDNLQRLAPSIDPEKTVGELSIGEQQLVELCKVLNIAARVVILDEPTSVLTPEEARRLHGFVRKMAADGVAVVLITHKLADVEACADRIAIMRRGEMVRVVKAGQAPMSQIVTWMMGSEIVHDLPRPPAITRRVDRLVLQSVRAEGAGMRLKGIDLAVAAGEVVGIAGVAGNGQTLLAETIAGVHPLQSGSILLDGESIGRTDPRHPAATPLGYIPENPRGNAIVETMSLADNLRLRELASGAAGSAVEPGEELRRFNVNPPDPAKPAGTLSGGNLQKLVAARELGAPRKALLACYPTMGLDLAAIEMIYSAMFAQARAGAAVLWISEDLDDLIAAAHRVAVLREGAIVAIRENDGTISREEIGALMTGMQPALSAA